MCRSLSSSAHLRPFKQCPIPFSAIFCLLLVALAKPIKADSVAAPTDYLQKSANGQFELVMLPTSRFARQKPELRKRYRQSGLYRKGAPQRPLWTIDWFAWQVYPASDGHHLVRMGPWPSSPDELAVAFYRDGRLLRQYKINQLVKFPQSLPHSVSHFMWSESVTYNDVKRQLQVKTLNGEKYLFNAEGRLLEGRTVSPYKPKSAVDGYLHKADLAGLLGLGAKALPEVAEAVRTSTGRTQETALLVICANGKASLPQLARLRRDKQKEIRKLAAMALMEISAPEGRAILVPLLEDKAIEVRIGAIAGLMQIHQETAAIPTARTILRSGTDGQKRDLLFALRPFRTPALVPDVLPLLNHQSQRGVEGVSLAERVGYWLEATTFQQFDALNVGSDGRQKVAKAWQNWWSKNQKHTSDQWYVEAVERDLTQLTGEGSDSALRHLKQLTGQRFEPQNSGEVANVAGQWNYWWSKHKQLRPGQILIASLRSENASSEALGQLALQTDRRDVADLVDLYLFFASKRGWEKDYIEVALRRITNVDSFAINLTTDNNAQNSGRMQNVLREWRQFAA